MLPFVLLLVLLPFAAKSTEDGLDITAASPSSEGSPSCCGSEDLKQTLSQLVQEEQENRGWYTEMVKLLTQLVQEKKEVATGQSEILNVLRVMRNQQEQQLGHLMNMARHQSLLVENHQALLFQVSRISSQLQELTKKQ